MKKCIDVPFGTFECSYAIKTPFPTHPDNEPRIVNIDRCLAYEILSLWEKGIRTTACCCGHHRLPPTIAVEFEDVPRMEELGYRHYKNKEHMFIAHTILHRNYAFEENT